MGRVMEALQWPIIQSRAQCVLRSVFVGAIIAAFIAVPVTVNARSKTTKGARTHLATVLGTPIYADEMDAEASANRGGWLEFRIVDPLQQRFCATYACHATDEEIRSMLESSARAESEETAKGRADDLALDDVELRETMKEWISGWKFHAALYKKYGGKVIGQVLGLNAVGAYRAWLEEEESKGNFRIVSPKVRSEFYGAVSAYGGRGVSPEEARKGFDNPPWAVRPKATEEGNQNPR